MDAIQNITSIFTADLLKSSLGSPTTNTVIAPYFMIPIVVLAYIGTKNPQSLNDDNYNSKNLMLLEAFTDTSIQHRYGISLRNIIKTKSAKVLNKLFVNSTYQIEHYVETVANRIGFDVERIDMTYRYPVQQQIMSYLRDQGYDNKKLPRFSQLKNVQIVLLNGVEFKGEWEYPYDIKYLKWIRFWPEQYRYKLVEAMHFEAVFPYAEYCDMRLVAVPYNNIDNKLALMIVLPNSIGGLNKILNQLDKYQEKILNTDFELQNVNVDVPIFTLEEKTQITNVLYKMCFGGLFRSNATLNNFLTSGQSISLDNIDHHVVLFVNGTVTKPENVKYHCPDKLERVIDFKVDRPFLFYIMDMDTRMPYFSGLVTNFAGKGKVDHSKEYQRDKMFDEIQNCRKIETGL